MDALVGALACTHTLSHTRLPGVDSVEAGECVVSAQSRGYQRIRGPEWLQPIALLCSARHNPTPMLMAPDPKAKLARLKPIAGLGDGATSQARDSSCRDHTTRWPSKTLPSSIQVRSAVDANAASGANGANGATRAPITFVITLGGSPPKAQDRARSRGRDRKMFRPAKSDLGQTQASRRLAPRIVSYRQLVRQAVAQF